MLVVALQHLLLSCAVLLSWVLCQARLKTYVTLWALFHWNEYFCTAGYCTSTLTPYLFLLLGARGAAHLMLMHMLAFVEYRFGGGFRPWVPTTISLAASVLGAALALSGIVLRGLSMKTAGNLFSHYIETRTPRPLVTSGVYSWVRHPSYTGFCLYALGMQLVLNLAVVPVISTLVLHRFFLRRIVAEEYFLVQFHGAAYNTYRQRVPAMVPLVPRLQSTP